MKSNTWRHIVAFVIVGSCVGNATAQEAYTHVKIADCHVHLLDFLQNGDFFADGKFVRGGTAHQALQPRSRVEALLQMMDFAHVSDAQVMGMPFVKKWSRNDASRGGYYLDSDSRVVFARDTDYTVGDALRDFRDNSERAQEIERLHPFICGFDPTDLGAVDRIGKTIKAYPGLWKGIGEVMSRHDDLTNLTTGERPSADHPALHRVYDFAGQFGMPVSIHHNIAPISPSGAFHEPEYLPELVSCFKEHPKTVFIWCHAGISRRIQINNLPRILDSILSKHSDHVYIDLSWVVLQDYVLKDLRTWSKLMAKYPDNFVVGSDIVGGLRNYVSTIRAYDKLFAALKDEELVEKVASGNFVRIMPEKGVTLPADYKYPEYKYVPRRPRD
ncbi:MAG TPA: hypothetical protein VMM76_27975 [Pirellulaceae bacterium]|nr:hypothetical protein [Pirellulaceae bacterium]